LSWRARQMARQRKVRQQVIYCIFSREGDYDRGGAFDDVYIGRTDDIRHRMSHHFQQPDWCILDTVDTVFQAGEREAYWKNYWASLGVRLLNRREIAPGYLQRQKPLKQLAYLREAIKNHGDSDECLLWPHSCRGGYGQVPIGNGEVETAHRQSWKESHPGQEIPDKLKVRHSKKCEQKRSCFNPNHLQLGTQIQNSNDAKEMGYLKRPPGYGRGEANGNRKLTGAKVTRIRELYAEGMSQRKCSHEERLGVL
jgi:hypothetical protein